MRFAAGYCNTDGSLPVWDLDATAPILSEVAETYHRLPWIRNPQRQHHIHRCATLSTAAMPLPRYAYSGPIDHTVKPALENAKGKSVIITGGANGIGEACVRRFVAVGAFVTFSDQNERGRSIQDELNSTDRCCAFVKSDVRSWEDQKAVFEIARNNSPSRSVDIVIANAGISRSSGDSLWKLDGEHRPRKQLDRPLTLRTCYVDPNDEPTKPDLNIVRVNLDGTLYTWKLATHYFRKQAESDERDRCFTITGSMVAWIDSPVIDTPTASIELTVHLTNSGQLGIHRL